MNEWGWVGVGRVGVEIIWTELGKKHNTTTPDFITILAANEAATQYTTGINRKKKN